MGLDFFYIIFSIGLLTIVILFHEMGHFLVARMFDIGVSTFSIGFGRPLFSFIDSNGTKWQISWVLIGGYVKFDQEKSNLKKSTLFENASLFSRFATVLAGPLASLFLAFIVFIPLFWNSSLESEQPIIGKVVESPLNFPLKVGDRILEIDGRQVTSFNDIYKFAGNGSLNSLVGVDRDGDKILIEVETFFPPIVHNVELLSPADKAGILPGDFITAVNGIQISSFDALRKAVFESEDNGISLDLIRRGEIISLDLEKKYLVNQNIDGKLEESLRIGISGRIILFPLEERRSLNKTFVDSFKALIYVIELTFNAIMGMLNADIGVQNISGPVGITYAIGETTKFGVLPTLGLIGMISASIGILNLLPIPILDGGHLVSYLLEFILGRRIVNMMKKPLVIVGVGLLAALFSIGLLNDISKIFS